MEHQKLFMCRICKLRRGECIFETCAKNSPAGHDLIYCGAKEGYCDCGAGNLSCHCKCNKVTENNFIPGPCTFNKTGKTYIYPFYRCLTCRFKERAGCCESCAKTCHLDHDLIYCGCIRSYCDCGAGEADVFYVNTIKYQILIIKLINKIRFFIIIILFFSFKYLYIKFLLQ